MAITIPRAATPGEAGVSKKALAELMREVIESGHELHSIMVVRHGQVAYEGYRAPYGPSFPHMLYSVSKSITSIAVGYAVEEGRFRLEDKVADLLPELRDYDTHENLEKLTVRHLITMSAGKKISFMVDRTKKQWIKDYGLGAWDYAPGEGFSYVNENIYLLCAIVHRVTGACVTDYLMPRLFEPLGIARPYWENDGCGVETGGWGLFLRLEDLTKIAMCYLDEGKFQGRQVIPAHWVRESSSKQVDSNPGSDGNGSYGYGYCFWRNKIPGSFRMDGMFGQFALIFPENDACVVTNGGQLDMDALQNTLLKYIPALFEECEEEDIAIPALPAYPVLPAAPRSAALEKQLNGRCIRFPNAVQRVARAVGFPPGIMPAMIFFMSADKAGGIDRVHLRFGGDRVKFSWSEGRERNTVLCGMAGRAYKSKITLGGVEFVLACSAAWQDGELHMQLRAVNSVAERRLRFQFRGQSVRMLMSSNPDLHLMVGGAANAVRENFPNKALGELAARMMGHVVLLAEPPHVGYMKPLFR